VQLGAHLHLVPSFRMFGATRPLPIRYHVMGLGLEGGQITLTVPTTEEGGTQLLLC
jgi:hypothetical protein